MVDTDHNGQWKVRLFVIDSQWGKSPGLYSTVYTLEGLCVCVYQTVNVKQRESSEGQRKEIKVFLSLPGSLSAFVLNECIVIYFPSQPHLYFYWITPDAKPEPT